MQEVRRCHTVLPFERHATIGGRRAGRGPGDGLKFTVQTACRCLAETMRGLADSFMENELWSQIGCTHQRRVVTNALQRQSLRVGRDPRPPFSVKPRPQKRGGAGGGRFGRSEDSLSWLLITTLAWQNSIAVLLPL